MIDVITITDMNDNVHHHPCVQFNINQEQRFLVVGGVDPDMVEFLVVTDKPGFKSTFIGLLDDQPFVRNMQITNSLSLVDWDFKTFGNPIIFIIQTI